MMDSSKIFEGCSETYSCTLLMASFFSAHMDITKGVVRLAKVSDQRRSIVHCQYEALNAQMLTYILLRC